MFIVQKINEYFVNYTHTYLALCNQPCCLTNNSPNLRLIMHSIIIFLCSKLKYNTCIQMHQLWHWICAQSASKMHFISNTSLRLRYPFWNNCRRHMKTNSLMSRRAHTPKLPCLPAHWTSATDKNNAVGCNADSGNFLERNWSSNPSVSGSCSTRKMKSGTEGESNCCSRLDWGDWRSLKETSIPEETLQKHETLIKNTSRVLLLLFENRYVANCPNAKKKRAKNVPG